MLKKKNHVDRATVFSAIDLVPTLLELAGVAAPEGTKYAGEALPGALLGEGGSRKAPIFFLRPPDRDAFYGDNDLPDLAIREGRWKLLCEYDGAEPELYDLASDRGEKEDLADKHPELVGRLSKELIAWHQSMPADNGAAYVRKPKAKKKRK